MNLIGSILGAFQGAPLELGSRLPVVSQADQNGVRRNLAEIGGEGFLLVYFYPKAGTPNCTKQACGLRDAFAELTEKGVTVLGVSSDGPDAQMAFREQLGLPFDLLADEDGALRKAFGVPSLLGITMRQSFLFKDGVLVWRDLSATAERQAADVLQAIEEPS